MSDRPRISIVIPTRNRRDQLRVTLAALARQSVPASIFEVLVVANDCTDGTQEMLKDYPVPFVLRLVDLPEPGAAQARNAGARAARAELLLFLDDDVETAPQFVHEHLQAHAGGGSRVAVGYLLPVIEPGSAYLPASTRTWWQEAFEAMEDPGHRFTYRDLISGNVSLPASLFRDLGGFEEALACREDYELGIRLLEAGANFHFAAGAAGRHYEMPSYESVLRRARCEGFADVQIARIHPAVAPTLPSARRAAEQSRWMKAFARLRLFKKAARWDATTSNLLRFFERHHLRREWQFLMLRWRGISYWSGVLDAISYRRELSDMLDVRANASVDAPPLHDVDLSDGLTAAEAKLDALRPIGVRLQLGSFEVGTIPPEPGAEPLHGRHLRPLIARKYWYSMATAVVTERASR